MRPEPFPISLDDAGIACEMQLELEHMTLDEAIASGLFDLPDEPGMVQIPVTVQVSIPNHLLWQTPPEPEPGQAIRPGAGPARAGGGWKRFGNHPKAVAARNVDGSIRSTPAVNREHEAAAFRDLLAVMHGGSHRVAPTPAASLVLDDPPSPRPLPRTPDGTLVRLARAQEGPAEDAGDPKPVAAAPDQDPQSLPAQVQGLVRTPDPAPLTLPAIPDGDLLTLLPAEPSAGVAEVPRPHLPSFRPGESDGGPGAWVAESAKYPHSQPGAASYQQFATGAPSGMEYKVTVAPTLQAQSATKYFDGYEPATNSLIDAKNFKAWPNKTFGVSMSKTATELESEAKVAKRAGCTLELRVATQEKADLLQEIVNRLGATNVIVRFWPAR